MKERKIGFLKQSVLCVLFLVATLFALLLTAESAPISPESVIGAAESVAVVDAEKVAIVDGENVTILDADLERAVLTEAAPLAQIDLLNEDEEDPAELSRPALFSIENAPIELDVGEVAAASEASGLSETKQAAARTIASFIVDCLRYDAGNVDASAVAEATFFSGYDGQFVFFGNWKSGRSGSFGKLMGVHLLSKGSRSFSELLKHEHGHYEQYLEIGLAKYIFAIAIPSISNDPVDYYSQPWEVTADLLGGVTTHYHSKGSEEAGIKYLDDVKNADLFSVIFGKVTQ